MRCVIRGLFFPCVVSLSRGPGRLGSGIGDGVRCPSCGYQPEAGHRGASGTIHGVELKILSEVGVGNKVKYEHLSATEEVICTLGENELKYQLVVLTQAWPFISNSLGSYASSGVRFTTTFPTDISRNR